MSVISMKKLLEVGVHFGHQTKRWNPKMAPYIFTSRNGIYIIDLQKSSKKIDDAYKAMNEIAAKGGKVLFVGTKKQAQEAVKEEAIRSESFYVNSRWLGGTLTNFKTIQKRIRRLIELEKMEADGTFDLLPKKEVILLKKEAAKLEKNLGGIKEMRRLPNAFKILAWLSIFKFFNNINNLFSIKSSFIILINITLKHYSIKKGKINSLYPNILEISLKVTKIIRPKTRANPAICKPYLTFNGNSRPITLSTTAKIT